MLILIITILNVLYFSLPDNVTPSRMFDLVGGEVLHQSSAQTRLPSGHGLRGQASDQRRHDHRHAL